jgi:hypothetical protein
VGRVGIGAKSSGSYTLPRITVEEAMQLSLPIDGTWKRIDEMSAEEFLMVAEMLLAQLQSATQCLVRRWLYDPDYSVVDQRTDGRKEFVARWYALERLLQFGVALPEVPKGCAA